jgi:hypothetical protein
VAITPLRLADEAVDSRKVVNALVKIMAVVDGT